MTDDKRYVIKIGSESVTDNSGLDTEIIEKLAEDFCWLYNQGKSAILVTSGAIAAGKRKLTLKGLENDISMKQAYASIGQPILMKSYIEAFSKYNLTAGQFLLTAEDMDSRTELENLKNTYKRFEENKVIPIVNENDTTAIEEINFGDNDILAALLTCDLNADKLIIMSSVNGIYKYGKIEKIGSSYSIDGYDRIPLSKEGRGGIESKLRAAERVTKSGKQCIISNAKYSLKDILEGKVERTLFNAV